MRLLHIVQMGTLLQCARGCQFASVPSKRRPLMCPCLDTQGIGTYTLSLVLAVKIVSESAAKDMNIKL
jgi:hypothetical protein